MKSYLEITKFDQWFIKATQLLLFLLFLLCIYSLLRQEIYNVQIGKGDRAISSIELSAISLIPLSLLIFFRRMALVVDINSDKIIVKFKPFSSHTYLISEIQNLKMIKYNYVGYGLRFSTKYGKVYNVKGNHGISFTTNRNDNVLIGINDTTALLEYFKKCNIPIEDQTIN